MLREASATKECIQEEALNPNQRKEIPPQEEKKPSMKEAPHQMKTEKR